jgi:hypothetical protein
MKELKVLDSALRAALYKTNKQTINISVNVT